MFSQPSRLVEFDKTILVKNTYFMSASVKIEMRETKLRPGMIESEVCKSDKNRKLNLEVLARYSNRGRER